MGIIAQMLGVDMMGDVGESEMGICGCMYGWMD